MFPNQPTVDVILLQATDKTPLYVVALLPYFIVIESNFFSSSFFPLLVIFLTLSMPKFSKTSVKI
jgi:hypothetical protein